MRFYQQILLVLALTLGMIAAGVAWERFYVSPLVEQAQRKPDPPGFATDDLPAACLEELSTMESSSTAMDSRADKPLVAGKELPGEPWSVAGGNVLRSGSKPPATQIQAADSAPSVALTEGDAAARPIQQAQSAEWNAPLAGPAAELRIGGQSPGETLRISAAETMRQNDARDALKAIDALDLMRRCAPTTATSARRPAASCCGGVSARSIWNLPGSFSVPTWKSASNLLGQCRGYRA